MTRRLGHTKRLGWGILGAGKIAATFAGELQAAGMHVAAVGSRDIHRARCFAAAARIDRVHGSYESLVEDHEVDVVYIATPQAFHAEQSVLAIHHGKPVLVEKSFTVTELEARRVASAARAAGVFVMEALWTRFLPSMVEVRERIAVGAIGEVVAVYADHHQRLSADPDNRHYDPALSGGALLDLGVYPVNLAVQLLGPVTSHRSFGRRSGRGVDIRVVTLLEHARGAWQISRRRWTCPAQCAHRSSAPTASSSWISGGSSPSAGLVGTPAGPVVWSSALTRRRWRPGACTCKLKRLSAASGPVYWKSGHACGREYRKRPRSRCHPSWVERQ